MGVQAPASARPSAAWRPLYSVLGDERLARLVGEGNKQAFAPLYERYYQQLYRYCRSIVHDDLDAQDALQSTFASAFAALRKRQRDAPLRPWLFRIAHNEAVSVIRRRRPAEDLSEASDRCCDSVEEQAGDRARFALLLRDLAELPERQRSALVMRELSGLSHEEIALVLGTSVGAAKQTIFEARRSLSEFAEGRVMACDEVRKVVSDADGRTLRSRRVRAHLSDCAGCAEFAAAIATRSADLRALSPALPATAAAAVLARSLGAGSGHGGGRRGRARGRHRREDRGRRARHQGDSRCGDRCRRYCGRRGRNQSDRRELTPASAHKTQTSPECASAAGHAGGPQPESRPPAIAPAKKPPARRISATDNRRQPAGAATKVTPLPGVSTPALGSHGAKAAGRGAGSADNTGSATSPQQAPAPATHGQARKTVTPGRAGGGSGRPSGGTGSSPVTVSAPGGTATVKVPRCAWCAGATRVRPRAAALRCSMQRPRFRRQRDRFCAQWQRLGIGSGASATVSVPNGTTVSVGGTPTLHLPGLGSVLGPLGGSGSQPHH